MAIVFGLLLFLYGCLGTSDMMQFAGAFFIAVGIFTADFVISERKKVKE
jgi:hypothetical protein